MIRQFPHCDARVLHAPGECEFCDLHPEWQALRKYWGIAFTGHEPTTSVHAGTQVPCPADFNRPPDSSSDHRRWHGNVATTEQPDAATVWPAALYGEPQPVRPDLRRPQRGGFLRRRRRHQSEE